MIEIPARRATVLTVAETVAVAPGFERSLALETLASDLELGLGFAVENGFTAHHPRNPASLSTFW